MTWYLEIPTTGNGVKMIPLRQADVIVLGRHRDCKVQISGKRVSRQHGELQWKKDAWIIKDLDSRNGTRVNGAPVEIARLVEGDRIELGGVRIRLVRRSNAAPDELGKGVPRPAAADPSPRPAENSARTVREKPKLLGRRYELGKVFHRGSTGLFHMAIDVESNHTVCVKLMAQHVTAMVKDVKRFVRGIRTAAKLHHPNIVRLYHAGQRRDGQWWLAMEYINGPSARNLAADVGVGNMLGPAKILSIARDISSALEVAFQRSILHRNIKPDSILMTKEGAAKLTNLTLSRGVVLTTLQQVTQTSEIVGDLAYLAPECVEPDGQVDCRSDMYSLGACLYVLLAGRPPFTGRGKVDLIDKIRHGDVIPPSKYNLSVGGALERVVMRCLSKSPTDRYSSPMELSQELARVAKFRT